MVTCCNDDDAAQSCCEPSGLPKHCNKEAESLEHLPLLLCDVITPGASPGVVQQGATLRDSRARITLSGNSKPTHYDYKQVCLQYNWRLMAQQQNALVFNNIAVFPY